MGTFVLQFRAPHRQLPEENRYIKVLDQHSDLYLFCLTLRVKLIQSFGARIRLLNRYGLHIQLSRQCWQPQATVRRRAQQLHGQTFEPVLAKLNEWTVALQGPELPDYGKTYIPIAHFTRGMPAWTDVMRALGTSASEPFTCVT